MKSKITEEYSDRKRSKAFTKTHKRVESIRDGDAVGGQQIVAEVQYDESIYEFAHLLMRDVCLSNMIAERKRKICHIVGVQYNLTRRQVNDFMDKNFVEHGGVANQTFDIIFQALGLFEELAKGSGVDANFFLKTLISAWGIYMARDQPMLVVQSLLSYVLSVSNLDITSQIKVLLGMEMVGVEQSSTEDFDLVTSLRQGIKSPIMNHIKTIASIICTVGLVKPSCWQISGLRLFQIEAFATGEKLENVFESVIQAMEYFFSVGHRCFDQKSLRPLLHVSDAMFRFETSVQALKLEVEGALQGQHLLDANGMHGKCYKLCDEMRDAYANAPNAHKPILLRLIKIVMELDDKLIAGVKSQSLRVAPFCFKVWGYSGVGKTAFTMIAMREILRYNGYEYEDVNIARIEPEKDFWENVTNCTSGYIIDDLCNTLHTKEKNNPADLLITLVNNQPFSINRAAVNDKGKVWANPKAVGVTTNNRTLAAEHWSVEPMSVVRRCHLHIDLKVHPNYSDNGMIDARKVMDAPTINGYIQDFWLISVFKVVKRPARVTNAPEAYDLVVDTNKENLPMAEVNMSVFLDYLYDKTSAYYASQNHFLETQKLTNYRVLACNVCRRPTHLCKCEVIEQSQAFNIALGSGMWSYSQSSWLALVWWYLSHFGFGSFFQLLDVYLLSSLMAILFPTRFEENLIKSLLRITRNDPKTLAQKTALKWVHTAINKSVSILPEWIIESKYFEGLFHYIHRIDYYRHYKIFLVLACMSNILLACMYYFGYPLWWLLISVSYTLVCFAIHLRFVYSRISLKLYTLKLQAREHPLFSLNVFDFTNPNYDIFSIVGISRLLMAGSVLFTTLKLVKSICALYCQVKQFEEQGNLLSPERKSEVTERENAPNVWAHSVGNNVKSTRTLEHVLNTVSKNLMHIEILGAWVEDTYTPKKIVCNAFMLTGGLVLMPYHMCFERRDGVYIRKFEKFKIRFTRAPSPNTGWVEDIEINQGHRVDKEDLIIFPVYGGGVFKNILELFNMEQCFGQGTAIRRTAAGEIFSRPCKIGSQQLRVYERGNVSYNWNSITTALNDKWQDGDCMTVIISDNTNPMICGFHLHGALVGNNGWATCVTSTRLQHIIDHMPIHFVTHSADVVNEQPYGKDIGFTSAIHGKSPVNFVTCRNLTVLGSCSGGATFISSVRSSILLPHLESHFGPQKWGPPQFKGTDGVSAWQPWYDTLEKLSSCKTQIVTSHLNWAHVDYIRDLCAIVDKGVVTLRPLTNEQVVNGIPGSRFISRMNLDSSMGYPLTKKKRDHMVIVGYYPNSQPIYEFASPSIWKEWYDMKEIYLAGKCTHGIFKASLKDEPTKIGKSKVRVFQAIGMGMQLGLRKYFMPILRLMGVYPLVSECAVGINPFSPEWNELHDHVTLFGEENCIAGDYKGWDVSLPGELIFRAFAILIELAQYSGNYTTEQLLIMKGLATDVAYATVNYNGTLIRLHGSNPSGQNLTAHINSICNSLLLRCAFIHYRQTVTTPFRDHVKVITYGDDFMGGVKSSGVFNLVKYAQYLREFVGIVVTMPDKESELQPVMNIKNIDFLKRKSIYCSELGVFVGALDLRSIHKSLYCTSVDRKEEKTVMVAVIQSAMMEAFFHGREVYETYIEIFKEVLGKIDAVPGDIFRTYEERIEEWHRQYNKQYSSNVATGYGQVDDTLSDISEGFESQSTRDSVCSKSLSQDFTLHINQQRLTNNTEKENSDATTKSQGSRMPLSFEEQSGVVTQTESGNSAVVKFTTLDTWSREILVSRDETFDFISNPETNLDDILKRPVVVYQTLWNVNSGVDDRFNVLSKWITGHQLIANKLNNYKYLAGTMCIKITVNGSPFMYGKTIAAIRHWPEISGDGPLDLEQMTALPYISITPQDATAGCLEVPLFHPNGAVTLTERSNPIQLDLLTMNTLLSIKETTDPVTITVWAWMKDYQLTMPCTLDIDPLWTEQAKDEYTMPTVSTVATTIGHFVGKLKSWPYIGPYARASEIALGATGEIAQLFGFSKPSQIQEAHLMQNMALGSMANCNGSDSCVKLATDAKNEVTVDPRVTGYGGPDDMVILDMCKREAYLTTINWSAGAEYQVVLWRSVVNPGIARMSNVLYAGSQRRVVNPTPIAHTSYPFQYWRGTIRFRFEVIATPFHQGKLRFVYDPLAALETFGSWAQQENLLYSRVLDLATERECVMEIGWGQAANYLEVAAPFNYNDPMFTSSGDTLSFDPFCMNGCIGVSVINPVTCSAGNEVNINVYISAGDDFELQAPSTNFIGVLNTISFDNSVVPFLGNPVNTQTIEGGFTEQSGDMTVLTGDVPNQDVAMHVNLNDGDTRPQLVDKLAHIHFGERIVSIRQLLKRYCMHAIFAPPAVNTGDDINFRWRLNDFPAYPGLDPQGYNVTLAGRFNYASPANFLNYFTPAFLMRRGAIRNKYVIYDVTPGRNSQVYTLLGQRTSARGFALSLISYVAGPLLEPVILSRLSSSHLHGVAGFTLSVPDLRPTLEMEMPNYNAKRWYFAQERLINSAWDDPTENATDQLRPQTFHTIQVDVNTPVGSDPDLNIFMRRYTAAGDDYSLHYYTYAPRLIVMDPLDYPSGGG